MLGTVLGANNTAMNKHPQNPTFIEPEFKWKGQIMSLTKMLEKKIRRGWKEERNATGKEGRRERRKGNKC